MINVIFNDFSYEIVPKQLETFEKYTKILQWGRRNPTRFLEDFMNLQFTDHQKYVLLSSWVPQNVVWLLSRSSGKSISLTNNVLTLEDGYMVDKPLKDIKVGDILFGLDGKPTRVLQLKPIVFEQGYEIEFADGEKIICNGEHLWSVYDTAYERKRNELQVLSTEYLSTRYNMVNNSENFRARYFVPIYSPLECPNKELPINPYLLGYFLGDGSSNSGYIACSVSDSEETMNNFRPYCDTLSFRQSKQQRGKNIGMIYIDAESDLLKKYPNLSVQEVRKLTFKHKLSQLHLINNKHIPKIYLNSSIEDRIALLNGILDSDGSSDKRKGSCEITLSDKYMPLINDLEFLLKSLGIKYKKTYRELKYIRKDGTNACAYRFYFSGNSENYPLFRMKRKQSGIKDYDVIGSKRKAIVNIKVLKDKIPMRCISVDNSDGTFLCGNSYTVTHNSFMVAPFTMARSLLIPSHNTYMMAPSGGQAQETFTKLENLAKDNIASVIGVSSFFLDETIRANAKADPFVHDKNSYHVTLYNGSTINTLNSVATNIVGIRSNFNIYDKTLSF